jgi:hypothetical protein
MTEEQKFSRKLRVVEEMERAARGEIGIEEGIRNTRRKYTHG